MKIKKTYYDDPDNPVIMDEKEVLAKFNEGGENPEWIKSIFAFLKEKGEVALRFSKLEIIEE